jgi:hypothetical protein
VSLIEGFVVVAATGFIVGSSGPFADGLGATASGAGFGAMNAAGSTTKRSRQRGLQNQ